MYLDEFYNRMRELDVFLPTAVMEVPVEDWEDADKKFEFENWSIYLYPTFIKVTSKNSKYPICYEYYDRILGVRYIYLEDLNILVFDGMSSTLRLYSDSEYEYFYRSEHVHE